MATASVELLARIPLFETLTSRELAGLAAGLRRRLYRRGEIIFLEGDPGSILYLIESGRVKIVLSSPEGKEVVLAMLGPADFFGDLALLDGEPRSAGAVAQDDCELLLLERKHFLEFVEARPSVATRLLAIMSRRLRRNAQLLQDAAFRDVPGRLARLILELAEAEGHPNGADVVIASRLTQTELAAMIGATRESVNKWLRAYERRGLIHCERGRIVVLDPTGLRTWFD